MTRRSIIDFEKWLWSVIETAKIELHGLTLEVDEVNRKIWRQQIKIEALQSVADKLQRREDHGPTQNKVFPSDADTAKTAAR